MAKNNTKDALVEYDKLLRAIAIIGTIVLLVTYFIIDHYFKGYPVAAFIQNLIIEILPIGLTFVASYMVLRKIQKIKDEQYVDEFSAELANQIIASNTANS